LADELDSAATRRAEHVIVMMHHPMHTLGDNVVPPFTDPVRFVERGADGAVTGIRYEYPKADDFLIRDVQPLLEEAGVHLVLNGHSHVWNRFETDGGVDFLETSNVGNTFGAYHELSGRARRAPTEAPWDPDNYVLQGDPNGLEPIVPTVRPFTDGDDTPLPYLSSNDVTAFSILDTGTGVVTSYAYDLRTPEVRPVVFDRFSIVDP
jgi:hypothetical protein